MCVSQISDYNSCIRSRDYVHLCIVQQQRQVQLFSKASPSQRWQCSEIVLLGHVLLAPMTATHKIMDSAILVGKKAPSNLSSSSDGTQQDVPGLHVV